MADKVDIVRSPLNYTGSKHRHMPFILAHMPTRIRIFEDWFTGGGNVFANVWPNKTVISIRAVDIDAGVIAMLIAMGYKSPLQFIRDVEAVIKQHGLNQADKDAYYAYRDKINNGEVEFHAEQFMALVSHAYNNMIRWNQTGEFNVPFGRRTFNPKMRDNTFAFVSRLNQIPNVNYFRRDFRRLTTRHLTEDDLVFCDPPYLISEAAYNAKWTEKDEADLHCKLDVVHARGSKFMLINALRHKGQTNHLLEKWSKKYNVVPFEHDYSKGYRATRKSKTQTTEVLVMNYEV